MKKFVYLLILFAWVVAVFAMLWFPTPQILSPEGKFTLYDKAAHFVFFGVMSFLILSAGVAWQKFKFKYLAINSLFFISIINIIGEYVQGYIPGRIPSFLDFLAGFIGTILAIPLVYMLNHAPRKKLLLHICCAPCATAVREILDSGFKLEFYFFNPNIYPKTEYRKRLNEVKKFAASFGIKLHIGSYDYEIWRKAIQGHEKEPEGGSRCELCYKIRLESAAKLASSRNLPAFATSLSISPHKNSHTINKIGEQVSSIIGHPFHAEDFKESNGWIRSLELTKKFGFYRQKYCGCEFSERSRRLKHAAKIIE